MKEYRLKNASSINIQWVDGVDRIFKANKTYRLETLKYYFNEKAIKEAFEEIIIEKNFEYYLKKAYEKNAMINDLKDVYEILNDSSIPEYINYKKFIINCVLEQIQLDIEGILIDWDNYDKAKHYISFDILNNSFEVGTTYTWKSNLIYFNKTETIKRALEICNDYLYILK